MRKRHPGYYVSVSSAEGPSGFGGNPAELLDGPWPTVEAAERRASKIQSESQRNISIVLVAEDGITIVRTPDIADG